MKLYYAPGACSLAAHIVSEEEGLGLAFEKVDLKAHTTESGEDYYRINPKGYVPALEMDNGGLLTENVAILQYLGDSRPGALVPSPESPERYRLQEWLGYITGELHKSFAPLFREGSTEDDKKKAKELILKRLKFVDDVLADKPYLMGASFGVADAYLFVMLTWCDKVGIDLSPFVRLTAFKSYVQARKGVQAAMKAEGLL